ncbi:artemin [Emys orbicularis]|uniref:artemin n=1 Tax=Emys orbicularis TaxID=82168 RepID=UPI0031FC608A
MRPHRSQEGADSMPARDRCPGPEGGASQPRPPEHVPQAPGAHDRMEQTAGGPASPPTRTLCQRPREGALWGALAILSLLSGVATGTPHTWHRNTTLGAAPTAGGVGTASPGAEDSLEAPLAAAWSHLSGDNVTAAGPEEGELAKDLLLRAERSPLASAKGKKLGRRRDGPNCTVRRLMVKVRDLGLGFDSDEIVPFKYCSGSCHRSRSNYDLTLATLLQEKAIKPGPPGHVASHPCCRPTRYEAVSFMNVQNTWQTVEKLSAAECKCIG